MKKHAIAIVIALFLAASTSIAHCDWIDGREVIEAKKHADESVEAGRHFVHAYAEFVHYVDGVYRSLHGSVEPANAGHHD